MDKTGLLADLRQSVKIRPSQVMIRGPVKNVKETQGLKVEGFDR